MAKQISRKDIAEDDLFLLITTSAETAQKKVIELNKELTSVGSSFKDGLGKLKVDNTDDITRLLKQVKELTEYTKQQTEAISQQEKITRELEKTRALKRKGEDDELARLQKLQTAKQQAYEKEFALLVKSEAEIKRLDAVKKTSSDAELLRLEKLRLAEEKTKNQIQKNLDEITKSQLSAQEKTDKIRIAQQKELDRQSDRSTKEAEKQAKAQEKANRESEKAGKLAQNQTNAYKRLESNTRELKNISKQLGSEMLELERDGRKNTQAYRDLERQYKNVTKSALEGDRALKKLDQQVGDNFRSVGNYERAVRGLRGALAQLGLAFGVFDAIKSLVSTQVQLDSLNLALKNVSASTKEYKENFAFLKGLSLSYGQDLLVLIDSYKNFIASTSSSNLGLAQRKRIYESVIKAGSSLALSNDNIKGSLLAISQMFSKGTVSAEELRGQLGERLPGAFGIMAESIGVSEAKLGDMMKKGQVLADEVMPRFAILLERHFGQNATERLQTLGGAWNVLKNNITLYFDEAQKNVNINRTLAFGIRVVGENIGVLFNEIRQLITAFIAFKAIMIANSIRMAVLNEGLLTIISNAIKGGSAISGFSKALRGVSFVLILDGIIKLTEYFIGLANGTDQATKAFARYENATIRGNKNTKAFLDLKRDELTEEIKLQKGYLKTRQITEETYKQRIKLKEDEINNDVKLQIKKLEAERLAYSEPRLKLRKELGGEPKVGKAPIKQIFTSGLGGDQIGESTASEDYQYALDQYQIQKKQFELYTKQGAELSRVDTELKKYYAFINESIILQTQFKGKGGAPTKDVLDHEKAVIDLNIAYSETNEYLSKQLALTQQLNLARNEYNIYKAEQETNDIIEQEIENSKKLGKVNEENYINAIEKERELKLASETQFYNDIEIVDTEKIKNKYAKEIEVALTESEKNQEKLDALQTKYDLRKRKYDKDVVKKNLAKGAKANVVAEGEWLLKEEQKIKDAQLKIDEGFNNKVKEINANQQKEEDDVKTKELIDLENHNRKIEEINDKANKKIKETKKTTTKEIAEYDLEQIQKIADTANTLIQDTLGYFIRVAETRMQQLDNYMSKLSQQMTFLEEKVASGSITAQESLAVVEKEQQEAEKRKLKEQRKQQRLQMAQTVFNAYNANVQKAKVGENALTKTLSDVAVLSAFIGALPTYFDGTDTTIADSLGKPQLQGRDGYIVRVDGSEKVLNPELSRMTGDMTTYEIAKLAEDKLRGNIISRGEGGVAIMNNTWQTELIVSELKDLKNTIRNKPETNIEVGEILGGVMKIVETKKQGNFTNRNITRLS